MAWIDYPLDVADALEDAFAGVTTSDPRAYSANVSKRATGKYFGKPVQDELLALHKGRVSSMAYRKTWTCVSGLAVGDPVYISANDTVTKADATDSTKNQVIGFVRYKPTTTTCYIDHFVLKTGLSGLTAGAEVFLSDAGGFAASAGTVRTVVGRAASATEAQLFGSSIEGFGLTITGTADTLAKFDGAGSLADSQLTDDGTDVIVKPAGFFAVEETGGGSDQLQFSHNGTDALIESTAGDIILEPFGGDLIVRQPGGTPGTDDLKLGHDGTDAFLTSLSGDVIITPAGGDLIVRQPSGTPGADEVVLFHDGTHGYVQSNEGNLLLRLGTSAIIGLSTSSVTCYKTVIPSGTRSLGSPSAEWTGLYLADDAAGGISLGLDQNSAIYYDEAGADQLVISGAPMRIDVSTYMGDNQLVRPYLLDYAEVLNAIGSIGGGTQDIDLTLGNVVSGTVDTSTTTFTFSNPPATGRAGSFTLFLTNGGSQTVNWPASVDWEGGVAPTLTAAGLDILVFTTLDAGTNWYGFVAGLDLQ